LKVWGRLKAKLKKFTANDYFAKYVESWGPNLLKLKVKLKRIESLMVDWGSNCINQRPRIKKKGVKLQGWCWSLVGAKLHKIKNLKPIRGVIEKNHKSKD